MRVNHAFWKMNERSRACRECLACQGELECALEDVEALVVIAVNVRRRTQLGSCCEFCHGQRSVRVVADDLEGVQVGKQPERFSFAIGEMNTTFGRRLVRHAHSPKLKPMCAEELRRPGTARQSILRYGSSAP